MRFEMSMRNELPEVLNHIAKLYGKECEFEESKPIWLRRQVDWEAIPREGEEVRISEIAESRTVEQVEWDTEGTAIIRLGDFDADEVGNEFQALEMLLEIGWEVDLSEFV